MLLLISDLKNKFEIEKVRSVFKFVISSMVIDFQMRYLDVYFMLYKGDFIYRMLEYVLSFILLGKGSTTIKYL